MNIEKLISELQERNVKKIDTYIYDEYGNHAITPKGRTLVKDITTDSFNQGALAVIEEMESETKEYLLFRPNSNTMICERIGAEETVRELLNHIKTLEARIKDTP